ncbi:MAG: helix-turn-helix domain-containing protein [Humibacter sp.]
MAAHLIRDGFPGQRLRVLPAPLIKTTLNAPVTRRLLVTDAGYFPHAAAHGRVRPNGAREAIVIVCVGGRGMLTLGGVRHAIRSGDAAIIPPEAPHVYVADEVDPWSIWWLHAAGTDTAELVAAATGPDADPVLHLRDVFTAATLIENIVTALERDETVATLSQASGAAWHLFGLLGADRLRGEPATRDRIRVVQDYLRDNLASTTPVPDLARLAGLSTSHFSALFKASTGYGVVEYVRRLRSARARELLMTTGLSIGEIAAQVGYSDAFYFTRQFRAVNGTSPSRFRAGASIEAI